MMLISKYISSRAYEIDAQPLVPAPFIVGAGRSGTTLLRMMLDSHPDLAISPESHFIPKVAKVCHKSTDPPEAFIEFIITHRRWQDFHLESKLLRQSITELNPFNISSALRAIYKLYAGKFGKPRWGDKTPPYVSSMLLIQRLLPEVRFIHIIRDGRDVALSIKDMWFGPNSTEEAARWWASTIKRARAQVRDLRYYLEIRYEDLVLEAESTLRKVCEFIDLSWNPSMLNYYERAEERLAELKRDTSRSKDKLVMAGEKRLSIHSFVTKPPDMSRIERWKTEMSNSDRKQFEKIAGGVLREVGYDTEVTSIADSLKRSIFQIVNRLKIT